MAGRRRLNNRGMMLIATYLALSVFLVYSSALTMRTTTQQVSADRLRERLQALDLSQAATEQLREDFFEFIRIHVYGTTGDAYQTMSWLDRLGSGTLTTADTPFDLSLLGERGATGLGFDTAPRAIRLLVAGTEPQGQGLAWVVGIHPTNPAQDLARIITIEATSSVGGTTQRIQSDYILNMRTSNIFRYAYFVNNYGWFRLNDSSRHILINGDVRANGDLTFTGDMTRLYVNGDLYASVNPEMSATGAITGSPSQFSGLAQYWQGKTGGFHPTMPTPTDPFHTWNPSVDRARPARQLTFEGQPTVGGGAPRVLPAGAGWDGMDSSADRNFPSQPIQDMPFLGSTSFYQSLGRRHQRSSTSLYSAGMGSRLSYMADVNGDGNFFDGRDTRPGIYPSVQGNGSGAAPVTLDPDHPYNPALGPDQVAGTSDDGKPLVLVGTSDHPIIIDGPVYVPGDVIIRGVVRGRGTIYAGRNVHIVGSVEYWITTLNPYADERPRWPALERSISTGQIRTHGSSGTVLGTLCPNGQFVNWPGTCS